MGINSENKKRGDSMKLDKVITMRASKREVKIRKEFNFYGHVDFELNCVDNVVIKYADIENFSKKSDNTDPNIAEKILYLADNLHGYTDDSDYNFYYIITEDDKNVDILIGDSMLKIKDNIAEYKVFYETLLKPRVMSIDFELK